MFKMFLRIGRHMFSPISRDPKWWTHMPPQHTRMGIRGLVIKSSLCPLVGILSSAPDMFDVLQHVSVMLLQVSADP